MVLLVAIVALLMLCVYLVFYYLNLRRNDLVSQSIISKNNLQADSARMASESALPRQEEWSPFTKKLKTWDEQVAFYSYRKKLIRAGSPMGLFEFFGFKIVSVIAFLVILPLVLNNMFPLHITLFFALALGYILPDIWLSRKVRKRQDSIRKDLPVVIDLLTLCVSGGLDFVLAVNRVIKDLKPSYLTRELAEVYRQTQMGKSRRDALKDFAGRVGIPEVNSFTRTLIQADKMGSPIADVLKMQIEEMRTRRFQRGEAMALKAPIKLLFPLFVFILPVVLILVGGPIIIQFSKNSISF